MTANDNKTRKWSAADVPDQSGRVVVVTGANTGIGYHTAAVFADRGAHVVLAVRNLEKGNAARARIMAARPGAHVTLQQLDLCSLDSVRAAADALRTAYPRIDVLINNAGVMWTPKQVTKDGFELQFGTNHLGHFALTGLVLDHMLPVPGSRVVTVSSQGHRIHAAIHFDDLQWERRYNRVAAYGQAKLANLLFTYELQRRLGEAGRRRRSPWRLQHRADSQPAATYPARRYRARAVAFPKPRDGRPANTACRHRSDHAGRAILRPGRVRRAARSPEGGPIQRAVPRQRSAAPPLDRLRRTHRRQLRSLNDR